MRLRIAAVLACLAVAAVGKPKSPGAGVRWANGWAAAVEEARALNLPLIVHRHGFY
ncbi:MAG: hypothetical protein ACYTDU_10415 [Planctomycetota bacterium]|jgi:hypothetical protein